MPGERKRVREATRGVRVGQPERRGPGGGYNGPVATSRPLLVREALRPGAPGTCAAEFPVVKVRDDAPSIAAMSKRRLFPVLALALALALG